VSALVGVLCRSGECEWEPGSNRVLEVPSSAAEMQVAGHWGDTSDTEALEVRLLQGTQHKRHMESTASMHAQ
jgi:hypothetical protein